MHIRRSHRLLCLRRSVLSGCSADFKRGRGMEPPPKRDSHFWHVLQNFRGVSGAAGFTGLRGFVLAGRTVKMRCGGDKAASPSACEAVQRDSLLGGAPFLFARQSERRSSTGRNQSTACFQKRALALPRPATPATESVSNRFATRAQADCTELRRCSNNGQIAWHVHGGTPPVRLVREKIP